MGWLGKLITGGGDEVGWDDLVRRAIDALAAAAHYGARGQVVFPAEVTVRITVPERSLDVVRGFVERPELDQEIGAGVANRCDVDPDELPVRDYLVSAADRATVTVTESAPKVWQLEIDGGDHGGRVLVLPSGAAELGFGRGEWHGGDRQVRNDLVVCETTEFVSRRAGRLYRVGHHLEVESLDQGDQLLVRRAGGEAVRPARTARGRVTVRAGDAIELLDGRGGVVRLVARRVAPR